MDRSWRVAWITGASSGIGRALAERLARAGILVAASARSGAELKAIAAETPGITPYPLDVTNAEETLDAGRRIAADLGPIDLAIFCAGLWQPMGVEDFSSSLCAKSMDVNFFGITNAIEAVLPDMLQRNKGQIGLMSSVAGFRGLPKSAAYAPTKAAFINLGECLRHEVHYTGVKVSVINPGFVETPMTRANTFPMPFMIKAEDAANRIFWGLRRGDLDISFPWPMAAAMKLGRSVPASLYFWFTRTFNGFSGRPS